jgi:hypothetical protein
MRTGIMRRLGVSLLIMIRVPRHHARAVLHYLDASVGANQPYAVPEMERTDESRWNPYHVSATAQTAHWRSVDDSWRITQSSRWKYIEVECEDRHATIIALRWGDAA